MPKKYTKDQLQNKFDNLPNKTKVTILWEALDYMNQYNGDSKLDTIILAMGYSQTSEEGFYRKDV